MSKKMNVERTCDNCMHCLACHLWSNGAISNSVAPKCPQFKPARYASLAELQDLYRMYKGELVPVVHGQWEVVEPYGWNHRGYNVTPKIKCSACEHVPKEHKTEDYGQGGTIVRYTWDRTLFCPNCGAKMDAEEEKECRYGMTTVSKLCSVMNSLTASIMTFGDAGTDES